jgi:hypothetical protein
MLRASIPLLAAVAVSLGACGDDASGRACAQPVREELDPGSLVHVVDPATARFTTDPPTSGPHTSSAAPAGAVDDAIPGAVQVAILERGDVLIQYRDVDAGVRAAVRALAGDRTVVAPNPTLPAPIVATAWTYRLTCRALDTDALSRFVEAHAGRSTGQ